MGDDFRIRGGGGIRDPEVLIRVGWIKGFLGAELVKARAEREGSKLPRLELDCRDWASMERVAVDAAAEAAVARRSAWPDAHWRQM